MCVLSSQDLCFRSMVLRTRMGFDLCQCRQSGMSLSLQRWGPLWNVFGRLSIAYQGMQLSGLRILGLSRLSLVLYDGLECRLCHGGCHCLYLQQYQCSDCNDTTYLDTHGTTHTDANARSNLVGYADEPTHQQQHCVTLRGSRFVWELQHISTGKVGSYQGMFLFHM